MLTAYVSLNYEVPNQLRPADRIWYNIVLPPPTNSMTFNPSSVANFLSCYKVQEHFVSGRLHGMREKEIQNVGPLIILILFPECFSTRHNISFGQARF